MISETDEEQAALHALGLLDADESAAFERRLGADGELRTLAEELRETVSELAWGADDGAAPVPPDLRARVLARVATAVPAEGDPATGKVVAGPWGGVWLPWALAALLMICCGVLAVSRERWRREVSGLERKTAAVEASIAEFRAATPVSAPVPDSVPEADALRRVAFCPLEPQPQTAAATPRVAVLWDAARREGKLRVAHLPAPGEGKDYQLWVVEDGRKDAVSAGVVSVGGGDTVEMPFAPVPEGGKESAVAFALSVERAGGSPRNEGPILFLGKL